MATSTDESIEEQAAKRSQLVLNLQAPFVPSAVVDGSSFASNFIKWGEITRRILTLNQLSPSSVLFRPIISAVTADQLGAPQSSSTEPAFVLGTLSMDLRRLMR